MTKDEIIRTLRESCDKDKQDAWQNGFWVITQEELERFATLVAEHEREACAKVCEDKNTLLAWATYAQAIRARGQA